ncbi:15723_t:CDS:1, partial [Cetraspora pellucida]
RELKERGMSLKKCKGYVLEVGKCSCIVTTKNNIPDCYTSISMIGST